jgi:3-oxoacyl-[acyl-carrier-protein] synthase-1
VSERQVLAVTGSSLVCSLGLDPAVACAAMRAGIVRPTELDTFLVGTLDAFSGVTVHEAPVITHGFEGDARALRLLQAAFEGLGLQSTDSLPARTAFYVSLPHPDREHTGFDLIVDEDLRRHLIARWQRLQDARVQPDFARRAKTMLETAAVLSGWESPVHLRAISMSGNTGVAEMIAAASRDLAQASVDAAIVVGVDSWIDQTSLQWLDRRGRLKSPTSPAGLAPGEAAGFIVMQTASRTQPHGGQIQAIVHATIFDDEQNCQLAGKISVGESLATVLTRAASFANWSSEATPWLVVDHNGESYRAREWGCALTRLVQDHPAFHRPVLWYPVISVGDTGSATGIVQTIMALQAFERGYAKARQAVLLASADSGQRSATVLGAWPQ